ncbi:MAG: class I SAM-dependent methyltransferase [Deltaproteobacteria bacterium]|nr:class I SAM-dependent methyltransferase [Deltaproteobacteria bacterium]
MSENSTEADRISREARYYDKESDHFDPATTLVDESFQAPTAVANQHILSEFGDIRGKRILDYGCGVSEGGVYLAKLGARVVGMDVSPGQLANAQQLAARHDVKIETRLVTESRIPADDNEFDLIYGNGVLHHVPLESAVPELARILKAEGKGCFIEPLPYNPLIKVYRALATRNRTDDERPLAWSDVENLKKYFSEVRHREMWLTTQSVFLKFFLVDRVHPNTERYWKKIFTDAERLEWFFSPLKKADDLILEALPFLRRFCWVTVITTSLPKKIPLANIDPPA